MTAPAQLIAYSQLLIVKIALLLLLTIIFLIPHSVYALEASQSPEIASNSAVQAITPISPASPQYMDLLINNIFHSFSCIAIGQSVIGQPCLTYQVTQDLQGKVSSIPVLSSANMSGGILGTTTGLLVGLYDNQPIRSVDYLATIGSELGIVKEAHAQVGGSGAAVLNPVLSLWQVSRNISYIIMIIIFVAIGFMVMFRQKLNPQTVISVQAALPGLVIGLVMITFSYFLAALITDVSFIGINVVGAYFSAAQGGAEPLLVGEINNLNVGSIFSKFVGMITPGDIAIVLQSFLDGLDLGVQFWVKLFASLMAFQAGSAAGGPIGAISGTVVCGVAPAIASGGLLTVLGAIGGPVCGLIGSTIGPTIVGTAAAGVAFAFPAGTFGLALYFVAIAVMIYTLFRLLFRLINNYLAIIFLTITAPFTFLAASLPGRQELITDWIRNMLCNVLAFPAVFAVFYFVAYLWGDPSAPADLFNITATQAAFGNQTLPLFGGLDLSFIRILIAYGALLATPAIPDIICKTIGKPGQAEQMIGQGIMAGTKAGQGYAAQTQAGIGKAAGTVNQGIEGWYGRPPGSSVAQLYTLRRQVLEDDIKERVPELPERFQRHTWTPETK